MPTQIVNGNMKNTKAAKLICQLIADLQRGRTCNSKLVRRFRFFIYGGQLSTDKLVLQVVLIFIVSFSA